MLPITRIIVSACAMVATTVMAAQAAPKNIGENIPSSFVLISPENKEVNYDAVKGEKGAIILFVRSLDWCPYCINQVKEWNKRYDEWRAKGYEVVSVSYDAPETLRKSRVKHGLKLPVYSDRDSAMIMAFGILNDEDFSPTDTGYYGVPKPAIYIADANGVITHRFSEKSYSKRPKISKVKQALGQ